MILSHRHRFIFICNGKTGTTSIEKALAEYDESVDMNNGAPGLWANKHMPAAVAKAMVPSSVWRDYYKFVFVRHPMDWFISQWKYNFTEPDSPIFDMLRHPDKALKFWRMHGYRKSLAELETFGAEEVDFLWHYLKPYRGMPLSAGALQSSYVYDADGEQIVDFVGRFEQLESDVQQVAENIALPIKLPKLNVTKHKPWQECLSEGAQARIAELWAEDFEHFGYTA